MFSLFRGIAFAVFTLLLFPLVSLPASAGESVEGKEAAALPPADVPSENEESLPSSFRGISLGMDIDAVKEALSSDRIFGYRGERDVSLIPGGQQRNLIETSGSSFISRSWFQFYEGVLYNMAFALDSERIDYFSIFSSLVEKYGEPDTVDPSKSVWNSEKLRLSLERPLTVKYIDLTVFNSIVSSETDNRTRENILRDDFVSEF